MFTPGSRPCVYKTVSGRHEWQNRDPLQEQGGINLYEFIKNNPLRYVDNNGKRPTLGPLPPNTLPTQSPSPVQSSGNRPVENPGGAVESPAEGVAAGLQMIGEHMDEESERDARNEGFAMCEQAGHSSGKCWCCEISFYGIENAPGLYYYSKGIGIVSKETCDKDKSDGGYYSTDHLKSEFYAW